MLDENTRDTLLIKYPFLERLVALQEVTWLNPNKAPTAIALCDVALTSEDVADASRRLKRFAPYIARVFPETKNSCGIIESEIIPIPTMKEGLAQRYHCDLPENLWLKKDSHLPISGSMKARGGIYEVLQHAEELALAHGLLDEEENYTILDSDRIRDFFSNYEIAVGSTGNLGLAIGIMSARLGFQATVHMSAEARSWKKNLLRAHGVTVVEYATDYSKAVEEGRRQAAHNPKCHFVDDEHSKTLFLGYAVAAERLQAQLAAAHILVNEEHPLFVYLPCGVGGGPGGVTFGLKLIFGDHVHSLFAEPTHAPCMLLGVHTQLHEKISVQDLGIDNLTAADGLAVGRPSGFVGRAMQRLIDGYYTVGDEELYALLQLLHHTENIELEPSALAGMPGVIRLMQASTEELDPLGINHEKLRCGTHLVWATGGGMLPAEEIEGYLMK
ncbi:MAG: D-serine ammonia-lyase [Chthoniobacterales bacterium]